LDVARAYNPGRPQVNDPNDFETPDAYSVSVSNMVLPYVHGLDHLLFTSQVSGT
jgi:hypothetical protein